MQDRATWLLVGAIAMACVGACSSSPGDDGVGGTQDGGDAPADGNAKGADGMSTTGTDGGAQHDGGSAHDSGGLADAGCAPAVNPVVETDPDGPGYDCMKAGCHRPGGTVQGGLTITVAGTLYDGKGQPLPGATVYVTDSAGKLITLTSDNNANFWSGTSDGSVMPAGPVGTCLPYAKLYPPSQFEGAALCANAAAEGPLQAVSVSMCPSTKACTALGTGATNGECHDCHGTSGSPPAIVLP